MQAAHQGSFMASVMRKMVLWPLRPACTSAARRRADNANQIIGSSDHSAMLLEFSHKAGEE
jgi:hypothetical protein